VITLAIDVMSGDFGLRSAIPAVQNSLQQFPDLHLLLVGDADAIQSALPANLSREKITIVAAATVVTADDRPSRVLKTRPDSSMQLAIDAVTEGRAQGAVSAGNSGALMALGVLRMGVLENISRPAICAPMPTRSVSGRGGVSWILDLGANVDCDARQLHQFALMGNALVKILAQKPNPEIALLNIGSEAGKGNELVQEAAQLINNDVTLNFTGFVEGNTLYDGIADVVVCDGFTGNVLLKTAEGVAGFIRDKFTSLAKQSFLNRVLAFLALPLIKRFSAEINAEQYNGACLLGLKGVVVKSHGNASAAAFSQAIACAYAAAKQNLPAQLTDALSSQ
jgi:glycerol-3-phosphate acyltransferase PlsX